MNILGIETSCDETAAAVVKDGRKLLSNIVASQVDIHKQYGGVVPEIAARSHIEVILPVINQALENAFESGGRRQDAGGSTGLAYRRAGSRLQAPGSELWSNIDGIAVTYGPGLSGSLLIGTLAARTLALVKHKPLYPVDHVMGHAYANFIKPSAQEAGNRRQEAAPSPDSRLPPSEWKAPSFPFIALIVSGGHTQLVLFKDHFDYELLGQTQDDAVGEAFDKVAKIIGLPYPGGPSIQSAAKHGDPDKYKLPKPLIKSKRRAAHLDAGQGSREARTEVYKTYSDGALERMTPPGAKNSNRITGSASEQDAVVRGSVTQQAGAVRVSGYDFSFSGLKTAVLRRVQEICEKDYTFPSYKLAELLNDQQRYDLAATFQKTAVETLVDKTVTAYEEFNPETVIIGGGVAANEELRRQLKQRLEIDINYAPIELCTDNAAMIACLGYFASQHQPTSPHDVRINPALSM